MSSKSNLQNEHGDRAQRAPRLPLLALATTLLVAVSSMQGCSLILKNWIHPPEDYGPVEIPSKELLDKVRLEERDKYVLFEDKGGAYFKGKLRSLFAIDGQNYAILSTGGLAHDTSYLPVTVDEPKPGILFFSVLKTREKFDKVSDFLIHHRSLVKGNLAKYPEPEPAKAQPTYELNIDSFTVDNKTKYLTAICSSLYRGHPFKVKISVKLGMPPGLRKDGSFNSDCLMQFKAVQIESLGGESDLFVPALGERFQKLVFSPVLNGKTVFGVLPQMTHPFDVLKEKTNLRVLFLEPERGSDYCDIRLFVDLKHKKMTFLVEDTDFQTNFINAISREPVQP